MIVETPWFRICWAPEGATGVEEGGEPAGDKAPPQGGAGDDAGDDTGGSDGGGIQFGDNWRDEVVKGLKLEGDAAKRASEATRRWASPFEGFRSALAAQSKIGELTEKTKGMVKVPGKDASQEEIAAYHKARGVPESHEGYKLARPEVKEGEEAPVVSELDQLLETEFLKTAHKAGLSQGEVEHIWGLYGRFQSMAETSLSREAESLAQRTEDNLRTEWLKDYTPNMELANRFLAERLGEDAPNFLTMKLEGGATIGSHEPFVRMVVDLARMHADDGVLIDGNLGEGVSLDQRINEIYALRVGTEAQKAQYASKETQAELMRLTGLAERRKQSGTAGTEQ